MRTHKLSPKERRHLISRMSWYYYKTQLEEHLMKCRRRACRLKPRLIEINRVDGKHDQILLGCRAHGLYGVRVPNFGHWIEALDKDARRDLARTDKSIVRKLTRYAL